MTPFPYSVAGNLSPPSRAAQLAVLPAGKMRRAYGQSRDCIPPHVSAADPSRPGSTRRADPALIDAVRSGNRPLRRTSSCDRYQNRMGTCRAGSFGGWTTAATGQARGAPDHVTPNANSPSQVLHRAAAASGVGSRTDGPGAYRSVTNSGWRLNLWRNRTFGDSVGTCRPGTGLQRKIFRHGPLITTWILGVSAADSLKPVGVFYIWRRQGGQRCGEDSITL